MEKDEENAKAILSLFSLGVKRMLKISVTWI